MNATTAVTLLTLTLIGVPTGEPQPNTIEEDGAAVMSVKVNEAARSIRVQKLGLRGEGVTVAIIDTGVDVAHPDLLGAVIDEACFSATATCPNGTTQQFGKDAARDDNGHGTHTAGIIAGRGKRAPEGLAPKAKIVAIRVADGQGTTSTSAMIAALNYVLRARPDVQVINMSLGTTATYSGVCDSASPANAAFAKAAQALRARGVVIVAAAGNDGLIDRTAAPACVTGFLSVGAIHAERGSISANGCTDWKTEADRVACFSNSASSLDILAPGTGIVSTGLGNATENRSGTSQAAAVVSGAVALLLEGAPLSGARMDEALLNSGAAVIDRRNGRVTPRIDTRAALATLQTN